MNKFTKSYRELNAPKYEARLATWGIVLPLVAVALFVLTLN